jgi:rare lipoprotein A
MGSARFIAAKAGRAATAVGCCLALAACAAWPADGSGSAGLFKAQVGDISGGVAPGPHSVWYVQRQPAAYVKMGFATWQPARSRGLRGWFAHHFGRHGPSKSAEPSAVAAANLGLPVPSRVQVTNVASGAVITVRVDDKAPMGDAILRLTPEAAKGLGVDPGKPLLIRMRYLAPVVAYNERSALRYAFRSPARRAPAARQPAPTVLAAQTKAPPSLPAAAPPPPMLEPAVIRVADVRPVATAMRPMLSTPAPRPAAAPPVAAKRADPGPAAGKFRVQVGAFANLDNAHRAVDRLEPAGAATIEPVKRGAQTLYRVIVSGPRDQGSAERLRARVAQIGFTDARLLPPI